MISILKNIARRYLPTWAVDTVQRDNDRLTREVRELKAENQALTAYINGMQRALHDVGRFSNKGGV
jgi:hypothetical protein